MEINFKKLTNLLGVEPSDDLFSFENGKIRPYPTRLDFLYDLSNLYNLTLAEASNAVNPTKNLILDLCNNLIEGLIKNKHSIVPTG